MVDELRVARLLRSMSEDVGFLRELDNPDPDDPILMRAIKYGFITTIEAAIDVAQHICASEGWGPPDTNSRAFELLGLHEVTTHPTSLEMAKTSGFRSVLLHDYVRVDDSRVIEHLGHLDVFDDFAAGVAAWLSAK